MQLPLSMPFVISRFHCIRREYQRKKQGLDFQMYFPYWNNINCMNSIMKYVFVTVGRR